jgi:hypothetical protein
MYTWRNWRDVKAVRELENIREATSYAIQSQYAASEKILALAAAFQERIEPEVDVELFYRKMFDIYTAEGMGLDNWGVILGIGRNISCPYIGDSFGFCEKPTLPPDYSDSRFHPFDQLPFVPDNGAEITFLVTLEDEYFRLLLLYKAMANISASDASTQNKLLATLINTGIGGFPSVGYVLEVDTMVIRWVFEDYLTPLQLAVFKVAGTLARGAGVGWELYAINPAQVFGFDGSGFQPFDQAPFVPDKALTRNRS